MFFLYLLFNSVYILLDSIFEPKAVSLAENFYTAFYFVLYLVFGIYKGFNELYQQTTFILIHGVMVTQLLLEELFEVRVLVS